MFQIFVWICVRDESNNSEFSENIYIFGNSPFLIVVYLGLQTHRLAFQLDHTVFEN